MLVFSSVVRMEAVQVAPKEADPETSLQVDTMILEYLSHNAAQGLLAERRATKVGELLPPAECPDLPLSMIDAFLPMFKANHATEVPAQSLELRLRILQFTTLFTRRYTPNQATPPFEHLESLRHIQERRASAWYGDMPLGQVCRAIGLDTKQPRVPMSAIRQAREVVCEQLAITASAAAFYTSPSSLSLLDLLPMFLAVAAALNDMQGGNITQQLQELAASFMQQAVVEKYVVFGSQESDIIAQAFAWGYRQNPPDVWEDDALVNEMFRDEDLNQEVDGWAEVHEHYLSELKVQTGQDAQQHLANLSRWKPMSEFEDQVLSFLAAILMALPPPDLTQLEAGQLDGMTHQQTEELKHRIRYYGIQ